MALHGAFASLDLCVAAARLDVCVSASQGHGRRTGVPRPGT